MPSSISNPPSSSSYSGKGVMILPLFKLGTLALRTISKPFANRIKVQAGYQPRFRQFIINIAQAHHRLMTNVQRRIYGRATDVPIRPLNEDRAVQTAADLVGELFIFAVAGAAIMFEVHRNSKSEAKKEALRKQELEAIKKRDEDLSRELDLLKQKIAVKEVLAKIRSHNGSFDLEFLAKIRTRNDTLGMEFPSNIQSCNSTFAFQNSQWSRSE